MIKALLLSLLLAQVFAKHIEKSRVEAVEENEEGPAKRIIMPGTLWCGNGNKAENDDQLGSYADLDSCCRDHDHCDRTVSAFAKQYEYRNWNPYRVSDCECDKKFYNCLKAAKEHKTAAKIVGKLFFNILQMPCLEFDSTGMKATKGKSPSYK